MKAKQSFSSPSSISPNNMYKIKSHLEAVIQSALPITFPTKAISFSSFQYQEETDQWHFTLKADLPVPEECRTIKLGETTDKKHRSIIDFVRNSRMELLVGLKQEIGHMYFLSDEYELKTPMLPQDIALFNTEQGKWKLLNQAERICLKHQYPGKKTIMVYSEMAVEKNWFRFDELNKETPFSPLVYSHIEARFSFILANVTYRYYVEERVLTKRKIG